MESRKELIENGKYSLYCMERFMRIKLNEKQQSLEEEEFEECRKMNNSIRQRKSRQMGELYKWGFAITRLKGYENHIIVFGTLTFRDDILESTSKETRRRYVARFLKENAIRYMANIDFGKKEGREHYHFLALCTNEIKKDSWKYGYDSYRRVQGLKGLKKGKNYLLKLNNHSFKDSTMQERLIKSREKDTIDIAMKLYEREFKSYKDYRISI